MKQAEMFAVKARHVQGYNWKWRAVGSKAASASFLRYHDCLMDAQKNGYEVQRTHAQGLTAPGGDQHKLA